MKALNIAFKDLRILFQDRGAVVYLFLLPVAFATILTWAMSMPEEEKTIPLPLVNLDPQGEMAAVFVAELSQASGIEVVPYEDGEEARTQVEAGEIDHLLTIPAGFSQAVEANQPVALKLVIGSEADGAETHALQVAAQGIARDMSMKAHVIASLELLGAMQEASPPEYQVFTTERNIAQAESQFDQARTRPLVDVQETYPQEVLERGEQISPEMVIVPGMTVLFVFLTAQNTAMSIYSEKKVGSIRRLLAAPLGTLNLVVGKLLPNYVLTLVQMVFIFGAAMSLFPLLGMARPSLGEDPLALVVLSLVVALCSTSLGWLIVALARTENQISGFGSMILWLSGAVSGSFFPTFFLSGFLGSVGKVVPHYWANQAFNDLLVRGKSLADLGVPIVVLLGFTLVFFVVGFWRFDYE